MLRIAKLAALVPVCLIAWPICAAGIIAGLAVRAAREGYEVGRNGF
jgi:hypothetical protein